jgi:hypothetical protein
LPRPVRLLLATCLVVLASLGLPSGASAGSAGDGIPATSPGSLLFVQTASQGRLYRNDAGRLTLSLKASRWTHLFTDRPQRKASAERTTSFVDRWTERGFRVDPPNAALAIDRPGREVMTLELMRPRIVRGRVRYSVRPLEGGSRDAGRIELGRFGAASLFIDNVALGWCFGRLPPCNSMPLIVQVPAYTGSMRVTLSGSASFSSNQPAGPYYTNVVEGPNSLTVSGCACIDGMQFQPIMVQRGSGIGRYQLTTSAPTWVSSAGWAYIQVGPNNPVTYSFGPP